MASEKTIKKFLMKARHASQLSDFPRQKLGAVMVLGNKIITDGYNTSKTSPVQKEYNKYRNFAYDTLNNGGIHAEMMCLLRTRYMTDIDWSRVCIYIYREKKNGMIGLAQPCEACMAALKERGIKKTNIYYTTDEIPYRRYA